MNQKVIYDFSQLERDYNMLKRWESRVVGKAWKQYFADKANLVKSFMSENK